MTAKTKAQMQKENDDLRELLLESQLQHGYCLDNAVENAQNMTELDDMVDYYRDKYESTLCYKLRKFVGLSV